MFSTIKSSMNALLSALNINIPLQNLSHMYHNHWKDGRQGSGYQRFALLPVAVRKKLKFDIIILRMREGIEVPPHRDFVPIHHQAMGYVTHKRLNILIKKPKQGGEFYINMNVNANVEGAKPEYEPLFPNKRIVLFTPNKQKHGVTMVKSGTRYVLSLGWLAR